MSGSSDAEEPAELSEALEDLRTYLKAVYPAALARKILKAVAKRTGEIARGNPHVAIGAIKDFQGEVAELHKKGVLGIAYSGLIPADLLYATESVRHGLLLKFFKHYLGHEEYKALNTSFQLRNSLSSPDKAEVPSGMVDGLYRRLDKFQHGRQIYNQVSSGNLEASIYQEMKRVEAQIVPAGRVRDRNGIERVKQIFYRALKPHPSEFWVNETHTSTDIFDVMRRRLIDERRKELTLYGARRAWDRVRAVSERFVGLYFPAFRREVEEHEANPLVGKVIISRGAPP